MHTYILVYIYIYIYIYIYNLSNLSYKVQVDLLSFTQNYLGTVIFFIGYQGNALGSVVWFYLLVDKVYKGFTPDHHTTDPYTAGTDKEHTLP